MAKKKKKFTHKKFQQKKPRKFVSHFQDVPMEEQIRRMEITLNTGRASNPSLLRSRIAELRRALIKRGVVPPPAVTTTLNGWGGFTRGTKEEADSFYRSAEWGQMRYKALVVYGKKCVCCGATPETGAVMHVDHIKPRSKRPDLELNINNLQILCAQCNIGKLNLDDTDLRTPEQKRSVQIDFDLNPPEWWMAN